MCRKRTELIRPSLLPRLLKEKVVDKLAEYMTGSDMNLLYPCGCLRFNIYEDVALLCHLAAILPRQADNFYAALRCYL